MLSAAVAAQLCSILGGKREAAGKKAHKFPVFLCACVCVCACAYKLACMCLCWLSTFLTTLCFQMILKF